MCVYLSIPFLLFFLSLSFFLSFFFSLSFSLSLSLSLFLSFSSRIKDSVKSRQVRKKICLLIIPNVFLIKFVPNYLIYLHNIGGGIYIQKEICQRARARAKEKEKEKKRKEREKKKETERERRESKVPSMCELNGYNDLWHWLKTVTRVQELLQNQKLQDSDRY